MANKFFSWETRFTLLLLVIFSGIDFNAKAQTPDSLSGKEAQTVRKEFISSDSLRVTVYVSFVVNRKGYIANAQILRAEGDSCSKDKMKDLEREALRIVNTMPRWTKGKETAYTLPLRFSFPTEEAALDDSR